MSNTINVKLYKIQNSMHHEYESIQIFVDIIDGTNSRIAKLALLYSFRDMKRTDFDFKMQRINLVNT